MTNEMPARDVVDDVVVNAGVFLAFIVIPVNEAKL